jgi:NADH dehydrogenase
MSSDDSIGRVAVFGGTGFLGRRISARLADAGIVTRVAVRNLGAAATAEGVSAVYADVRDETSLALALEGCDAAVNAVGHYVEKGAATFPAIHELGARNVAHQAAVLSLKRLIHISGIGADLYSPSRYVRCRARGEVMVRDVFPETVILRPSVVFAPDDRFVNALAGITRWMPVLPLFGSGNTRLQPVYAGDVADAVLAALKMPEAVGKTYELGGPEVCTYRELIERILNHAGRRRLLLPVPFRIWQLLALLCSRLASPPVTKAQVTLMSADNVVASDALALVDLGVAPTALKTVLPEYRF